MNERRISLSAYLRGTKAKFWTVQFYIGGKRVTVPTDVPERPTQDRGKEEAKQVGLLLREKMVAEAAIPKPIIPTFGEISEPMFLPDSEYLKFEAMAGRGMSDHWRGILHSLLRRYILPKWGSVRIDSFNPKQVFSWLSSLPLSDHSKAILFQTIQRAFNYYQVDHPAFVSPIQYLKGPVVRDGQTRDVYTPAEIERLFPEDKQKLYEVWKSWKWALAFLLLRHTGMRAGELRALQWKHVQQILGVWTVTVQQAVKATGKIGSLKKREKKNNFQPDFRLYPLPPHVIEVLELWRNNSPYHQPDDWLIRGQDRSGTISKTTLMSVLKRAMERAGIKLQGRYLDVHSFRHTFTSEAFDFLSPQVLMQLNGHLSLEMLEHYKHSSPERLIAAMVKQGIPALLQAAQGIKEGPETLPQETELSRHNDGSQGG